jgi:peptidyl-prolyl cis-trans isomerase D
MAEKKLGTEKLAAARAAPQTALSDNTLIVSRAQTRDLPRQVVDAALKAPVGRCGACRRRSRWPGYAVCAHHKLGVVTRRLRPVKAKEQYGLIWKRR